MAMASATTGDVKPWGRFKLISKDPAEESDHVYFYRTETRIGRNPQRAHVVLDMLFISGVHCIVKLEGKSDSGDPIVKIQDLSRNGIFVNEVRIEKDVGAEISANATVHFTKPGLAVRGVVPTVYRFEILRDGLTPENTRLREAHDASTARLMPAAGMATPSTKGAQGTVATTQLLTGKRQRRSDDAVMVEEMEVEVTRTVSSSGVDASPSSKRRRTGERRSSDDDESTTLLATNDQLQKSNTSLRQKLSEAGDREAKVKQTLSQKERELDSLKDALQASEESLKLAENELKLKSNLLADREQQVARTNEETELLKKQIEELKVQLTAAQDDEAAQAKMVGQLKAEREKLDMDMVTMTSQLNEAQTKFRKSEEQMKALYQEKKKIELALDSVQSRTEQAEESKRGIGEAQMVLTTKINELMKFAADGQKLMTRMLRVGQDNNAIMSEELEALQRSDQSTLYSSEQSQPVPTQENFIGDTQPEEGSDVEQTLDQDAAVARAGLISADQAFGPFAADQSKISIHENVSMDLLDEHQQPLSSFSGEVGIDETPAEHTEGKSSTEESNLKSSTEESNLSSNSASSKTPPAPPLQRKKIVSASTYEEEAEESKGDKPDGDEDDHNADIEDEGDDEAEETALQDDEEDDKENTPVKSPASGATASTAKSSRPGWLQMVVSNEDEKSEQVSASEGLFDDETQLSGGE